MTFKSKLITAIATGAVLVNALAPMASADTITVSGNGEDSVSKVTTTNTNTTTVNQTNNANITNKVDSSASSGGNSANGNTGGDVTINAGSANATSNINNAANVNSADINCACNNSSTDVTVKGNGKDSYNNANVTNTNSTVLNQTNTANFTNQVNSSAKSGGNQATSNTGGNVTITTDSATANATVNNAANANFATLSGSNNGHGGSSVVIKGNGEDSQNGVSLDQTSALVLGQSNSALIGNFVGAEAKSGDNKANGNTDGGVNINAGSATTNVTVDNAANFNSADLSCDCVLSGTDVLVKGNGEHSWNTVSNDSTSTFATGQANGQGFTNLVDGNAKTGYNSAYGNTGSEMGDPSISTGAGSSTSNVNNVGNVNTVGHLGGLTIGTTIDFNGLWAFIHGFMA